MIIGGGILRAWLTTQFDVCLLRSKPWSFLPLLVVQPQHITLVVWDNEKAERTAIPEQPTCISVKCKSEVPHNVLGGGEKGLYSLNRLDACTQYSDWRTPPPPHRMALKKKPHSHRKSCCFSTESSPVVFPSIRWDQQDHRKKLFPWDHWALIAKPVACCAGF